MPGHRTVWAPRFLCGMQRDRNVPRLPHGHTRYPEDLSVGGRGARCRKAARFERASLSLTWSSYRFWPLLDRARSPCQQRR